jgi:hypothetical protein
VTGLNNCGQGSRGTPPSLEHFPRGGTSLVTTN